MIGIGDFVSNKLAEELSALLDDEAEEFATRRILREMEQSSELQDKWDRYCLIRDQLQKNSRTKGEETRELRTDFAAQISAAVKDEPTYHGGPAVTAVTSVGDGVSEDGVAQSVVAQLAGQGSKVDNIAQLPRPKKVSWVRRYGAVASVGLLALVVIQLFQFNGSSVVLPPATNIAINSPAQSALVRVNNSASQRVEPIAVPAKISSAGLPGTGPNKLEGYFRIHSEQSALGSSRGMMPYARVIHYREIH